MGIKGKFNLTVSLDTIQKIVSYIIPEGEIVDNKESFDVLGVGVNVNIWATRTGTFTTYVQDGALYLATSCRPAILCKV